MLDADDRVFMKTLGETRHGLRLKLAIHEGRVACQQIARMQQLGGTRSQSAIESWRRAYVDACNRASLAIDELWDAHQWPTDAGRARRFEWRPARDKG